MHAKHKILSHDQNQLYSNTYFNELAPLLCESGEDAVDCDSPEYVETIWRLLMAYPVTVLNFN